MDRKRILTGDRPTGPLHLGHYVGSIENRIRLQDEYECFFIVADLHTLTTTPDKEKTEKLHRNIREQVLDYLACGIDPEKSAIYLQSRVPEVAYLAVLFGMLVTVARLQRVPTLKEVMKDLAIEKPSFGLLGYPVLMAADILMVKANLVPVGKDQSAHIEVAREIARRFNQMYGETFPVPEPLIGEVPTLPGLDGKAKMSKSLGNCIYLSDDPKEVERKVMRMYTDPARVHPTDPGRVKGNPVFIYHDAFNPDKKEVEEMKKLYRKGKIADVEIKRRLVKVLNEFLDPIRQRREKYEREKGKVEDILEEGTGRAQKIAGDVLARVKAAMKIA